MDLKENALEPLVDICAGRENTGGDSITNSVTEKKSESVNIADVMEIESNSEMTSKMVSKQGISDKSTDKIQVIEAPAADVMIDSKTVDDITVKLNTTADEIVLVVGNDSTTYEADLRQFGIVNNSEAVEHSTFDDDVNLVHKTSADSGTVSISEAAEHVIADNFGNHAQTVNNNDSEKTVEVVGCKFGTKNISGSMETESLECNKLGKRKQKDNIDVIVLSSGSDTDHTITPNGRKSKQARTDSAEEKKRLIQLIQSYPVLYDPNHSDVKLVGSKKAAYQEIGNQMGLTRKFSFIG